MALPEPSSKEGQNSKQTNDQDDKDFDPTPEALIDEIDDERTLEEEEALNGNNGTAVQEELDDLKKESEMPIEELLAYYERMRNEAQGNSDEEEDEEEEEEEEEYDDEDGDDDDDAGGDDDDKGGKAGGGGGKGTASSSNSATATAISSSSHSATTTTNQPSRVDSTKSDKDSKQHCEADVKSLPRHRYLPSCGQMADLDGARSTPTTTTATTISPVAAASASPNQLETAHHHPSDQNQVGQQKSCNTNDSSVNVDDAGVKRRHIMTDFVIDDEDGGMLNSLLGYDLDDSDDMDEDYSYTDDENEDERDWRRVIHVGPEYQADVPEELSQYDDLPPYENEDKLAWKCNEDITSEQILEFLKQGSSLSKRNDISISSASVPKISRDSFRLYRERMQDITSSTGSHTLVVEHNHENVITEQNPPTENLTDVYMSQSRKRARIDYELERENAMDAINQACGTHYGLPASSREENSDSTSVDVRPELSTEEYFQDEEQLLFLLLQCNYNFEEALRRRRLDPFKYYLHEPMSLWSQDECLGFEHGLRVYGKNFRSIRENKVQTRTHAEVVAFYYLWKKSERHDVYTNQYKLDRKRCLSHPGTTDYMDKFIEDNESILNASSSTPTPSESTVGVNSNVDIAHYDNSGTEPLCHSSDIRSSIQYVNNFPQSSTIQRHHLQLQPPPKEDEAEPSNSAFIDSNTPL